LFDGDHDRAGYLRLPQPICSPQNIDGLFLHWDDSRSFWVVGGDSTCLVVVGREGWQRGR
jgi:hypothetical protein